MEALKVYTLLILCLINNVAKAFPPRNSTVPDMRLPKTTVPVHYNVKFIPYLVEGNFTFDGESVILCEVVESTPNIVLHSKDLTIDESFTSLTRNKDAVNLVPAEHFYDGTSDMLTVHFNEDLLPGSYTLHMKYTGALDTYYYGFYRSSYINKNGDTVWLAATHFQPTSARRAFPCWDEPALKATFNVSIKHNSNYTALSNMPAEERSEVDDDGKMWTHFQTTPVMSTNILAFIVADYGHVSNEDGTISVWCRRDVLPHVEYLLETVQKATEVLEEYMNSTVRVPKMDHVCVPTYSSSATENWGLVTYLERYIVNDDNVNFLTSKEAAMLTGVHEMAHMWFGNLVSPSWWKYLWLSEGFATYFKYYITNKMYKDWRMDDRFVVSVYRTALSADSDAFSFPLSNDVYGPQHMRINYNSITYSKGASVLRMLSHCLTEDVFRAGVIKYVDRWQYKAVTPDNLWDAMQDAANESEIPEVNFHVKTVMSTWTDQRGFPMVNVTRNYTTGEIKLTQKMCGEENPFAGPTENPKKWWIPLNFATQSDPDFSSTLPMLWLQPEVDVTSISDVSPDDWIILNIQQTGFYRVNYETENWRKIAKYLNSHNYTKIHVANRAQIIDDAYQSAVNKYISRRSFLEIINYLQRERDYIPWQALFSILMYHGQDYTLLARSSTILKPYALNLMTSVVDAVGFEEHPSDDYLTKQYRPEIIKLACMLGHTDCKSNATAKLIAHLADPIANKLTPELRVWTFCSGLRDANESIWMQVFAMYENTSSIEILHYLGCTEDPVIGERYLNIITADNSPILKDHIEYALLGLYQETPSNINLLAKFAIDNMAHLTPNYDYSYKIMEQLSHKAVAIAPDLLEKIRKSDLPPIINIEQLKYFEETLAAIEADIIYVNEWAQNSDADSSDEIIFIENNAIDDASSE